MKKIMGSCILFVLAAALSIILLGCTKPVEATPQPTIAPTPVPTPAPTPEPRRGGYLDEIVMSRVQEDTAVEQIAAGYIDLYASALGDPQSLERIEEKGLSAIQSSDLKYELTLNTVDTRKSAKRLNPLCSAKIREALNYLIDREYICQEFFLGHAIPKLQPIDLHNADYGRYIKYILQLHYKYQYKKEKALRMIEAEMDTLGAVINEEGQWSYKNRPVVLKFIIRDDDVRLDIGNYIADELESMGFVVERNYTNYAKALSMWATNDPAEGDWHIYTNAWVASGTGREGSSAFLEEYTRESSKPYLPYKSYEVDEAFLVLCRQLDQGQYATLEEREMLFAQAIATCNQNANRIWLSESMGYIPMDTDVIAAYDASRGIENVACAPYTLRFTDSDGGSLVWGSDALLQSPVNAVGGSPSVSEQQVIIFTEGQALMIDPNTGLPLPQYIERAEVTLLTGQPIEQTYDWVDVQFVEEIRVPNDAWIKWNAETQSFITADQAYLDSLVELAQSELDRTKQKRRVKETEVAQAEEALFQARVTSERGYLRANRKCVITYPGSLYDLRWHDGTQLSAADFVMSIIERFEISDERSALNNTDAMVDDTWKQSFKGYKILSVNPLVIESYHDDVYLDLECNATALWPEYAQGQAPWYVIAASNQAVMEGKLEYFSTAVTGEDVVWMDWLSGEGLGIIEAQLQLLRAQQTIPYEKVLGAYIDASAARSAYENLLNFYDKHGHFVLGLGPYYVSSADTEAGQVTLSRSELYDALSDKWDSFLYPMLANIKLDGPKNIEKGEENKFNIYITYGEETIAYPHDAIRAAGIQVYSERGDMVYEAPLDVSAADGVYAVVIEDSLIHQLEAGAYTLGVWMVPRTVSAPVWDSISFSVE